VRLIEVLSARRDPAPHRPAINDEETVRYQRCPRPRCSSPSASTPTSTPHLAVALDQLGRRLGQLEGPTTTAGFTQLYAWLSELGTLGTVGIDGTGAYGAGLCRWLRGRGVVVVELERPGSKLRRNAVKSDPIDAEAAARKVLSGEATVTPKSGSGNVEMIRVLRLTRRSAVLSRSQVTNQLHALTVTAPPALREQLEAAPPVPGSPSQRTTLVSEVWTWGFRPRLLSGARRGGR
jgi:hypothetical protein